MIRIEKEKRKVNIICMDNTMLVGYVHINPGERVIDFLNDTRESFIAVTESELQNSKMSQAFKVYTKLLKEKGLILLNKTAIKWIEAM